MPAFGAVWDQANPVDTAHSKVVSSPLQNCNRFTSSLPVLEIRGNGEIIVHAYGLTLRQVDVKERRYGEDAMDAALPRGKQVRPLNAKSMNKPQVIRLDIAKHVFQLLTVDIGTG